MKAFAINRIQRRDKDGKPEVISAKDVFDVTQDDFKKLEALGAARKATAEEVAIAKDKAERSGNAFTDSDDTTTLVKEEQTSGVAATAPKSGAANDPAGAPKGSKTASKSADSKDDLGV